MSAVTQRYVIYQRSPTTAKRLGDGYYEQRLIRKVEQTGIFAGKGGYDITVSEHTQLDGAVIDSTATADKNRLDTGTLGWGDIDNRADFKTEHQSVGFSSGGSIGSQFAGNMANGLLTGGNNEGHDSSTTRAAVSDGDIIVRDKDRQQQDVEHANQTLSLIFDKEKEQQRLQQRQPGGGYCADTGGNKRTGKSESGTRPTEGKCDGERAHRVYRRAA